MRDREIGLLSTTHGGGVGGGAGLLSIAHVGQAGLLCSSNPT